VELDFKVRTSNEIKILNIVKKVYPKANFTDVVKFSNVVLKLEESCQVILVAHRTNKFGARLAGGRRLHGAETDVADKASVVEEDVLAEVTVEDF
jgi:hypothetical protein